MNASGKAYKYLFGPVPSRRLGLSLGIDLVPFKTCTLDCIYCQLGPTTRQTILIAEHVAVDEIIGELGQWLDSGGHADWLTLSGSGEPTLNIRLGDVIEFAKRNSDIPVAVLTNGTLLWDEQVREDACQADLIIPSLDSATPEGFQRINRPSPRLTLERVIEGIATTARECSGEMWLEVMAVQGFNDSPQELAALRGAVGFINPTRVQMNTVIRPPAEASARPLSPERLQAFAQAISPNAEVVAAYEAAEMESAIQANQASVLALLQRRPCTIEDIVSALGLHPNEVSKYLYSLLDKGKIETVERSGDAYYAGVKVPYPQ